MREIVFCESPEDVADAAADLIHHSQTVAIEERGVFRIALSGGQTPKILYNQLAHVDWKDEMQWEKWEVFWSDERAIPTDSDESNYHMVRKALLSRVPVGEVWRMRGEAADLSEAADEYARTIKSRFGPGSPVFDVILLGMGTDGHTASLFPGHPAIESGALVEVVEVNHPLPRRLTLTLRVLNSARRVVFLVNGESKAQCVHDVLVKEDYHLPATRVMPHEGDCWWLLDHAAASLIR